MTKITVIYLAVITTGSLQEANTSFIHSKTKQSTNSSIHNSQPTKKVHEVDSLSEKFIISSPLYPTYHPTIIPHSIVIYNPLFNRRIIPSKYQNHVLGIRQGILFHKSNIFIFSPILQNDIVSNLMSVGNIRIMTIYTKILNLKIKLLTISFWRIGEKMNMLLL